MIKLWQDFVEVILFDLSNDIGSEVKYNSYSSVRFDITDNDVGALTISQEALAISTFKSIAYVLFLKVTTHKYFSEHVFCLYSLCFFNDYLLNIVYNRIYIFYLTQLV